MVNQPDCHQSQSLVAEYLNDGLAEIVQHDVYERRAAISLGYSHSRVHKNPAQSLVLMLAVLQRDLLMLDGLFAHV